MPDSPRHGWLRGSAGAFPMGHRDIKSTTVYLKGVQSKDALAKVNAGALARYVAWTCQITMLTSSSRAGLRVSQHAEIWNFEAV